MNQSSRICILGEFNPSADPLKPFVDYEQYIIESSLIKAGINLSEVVFKRITTNTINELNDIPTLQCIVTMGERPLNLITGKHGIDKWQLSPLTTVDGLACHKCVPTFNYLRLMRQYEYRMFFYKACIRAKQSLYHGAWKRKPKTAHLITEPDKLQIAHFLDNKPILSVDIETSNGTINTMGFAWSEVEGLAVRIEPGKYPTKTEFEFWSLVAKYLGDKSIKKILQNNIYEGQFFARYGIPLRGIWHDTMWAQKLLYPEFKQDLATVGRLFTNEIYWKEDGKDWTNIDNWIDHMAYNVSDTVNTFEAAMKQRAELKERGMLSLYDDYMIKLAEPLIEMCWNGLIVDEAKRESVRSEVESEIESLVKNLSQPINHRSPKQKLQLFKDKDYKIPTKKNKSGERNESSDEVSLKKLRLAHPDDTDLDILLRVAKLEKFQSSYINFDYHSDGVVRYSIKGSGTETLRFSSGMDAWDMGFNAQTIPKKAKKFFLPPPNHCFIQIDLQKAESYYVAYRSQDENLIKMLVNDEDIHSYVASHIFGCSIDQVIEEKNAGNPEKRQLGKKSGHGANYAMAATTFMEQCLKEDMVISYHQANNVLETYHRLFPGIRKWHKRIQEQVKRNGWLENPLGFRRYFWGRYDDNTFREAYAFEPQSTIPMITNHLMLYLGEQRERGIIDFNFHLQVHDSLVLSATADQVPVIGTICKNTDLWHPEINMDYGKLIIPTDFEISTTNLAEMRKYDN